MKLRKPCEHDRYDQHFAAAVWCPGGVFLPDDTRIVEGEALVIWKVDGEWPTGLARWQRLLEELYSAQQALDALFVREAE